VHAGHLDIAPELAGNRAGPGQRREYVLIGGYFGTWHKIADVADLPFTADGLRPAAAAPGAGIIWAALRT
jgi:hypothetical protein